MLVDRDIIYFGNDWCGQNRTSSYHVAKQLAVHNRLLYVESPGFRPPTATGRDLKRVVAKMRAWLRGPRKIDERFYLYCLVQIPFRNLPLVNRLNRLLGIITLRWVCRRLKFKDPIVWSISPHVVEIINHLKAAMVVYYCVDNFPAMPGIDVEYISAVDQKLTQKADLVFVTSETILESKKRLNSQTFLSSHGVDLKLFAKALDPATPIPKELAGLPRPIIGYFGLIEKWTDLELLKFIARQRPGWSLFLVGRVVQDISQLKSFPNVHFLGPRPYEELPGYAKAFDVAIIPYVLNEQTLHANPIKLREYLAAGKAVVSVRTPEVERFKEVVEIADSYSQFLEKVEKCIRSNTRTAIENRLAAVMNMSWEKHLENLSWVLEKTIEKKYSKDKRSKTWEVR